MGAPLGGGSWTSAAQVTGGNFIAMLLAYEAGTPPVVTDSKSNTWIERPEHTLGYLGTRWVYAKNATVGSGHTFTFTGTSFCSACIVWYAGVHINDPFDQELADTVSAGTSGAAGSLTPALPNSLVLAGLATEDDDAAPFVSINGSFTIREQIPLINGYHFGGAIADLVQTTVTAANPTWTWTSAANAIPMLSVWKTAGNDALSGLSATAFVGSMSIGPRVFALTGHGMTAQVGTLTRILTNQVWVQARAGIERAGASRAGYYRPNVVIRINGVDA